LLGLTKAFHWALWVLLPDLEGFLILLDLNGFLLGILQGFCSGWAFRGLPAKPFRWLLVWHVRKFPARLPEKFFAFAELYRELIAWLLEYLLAGIYRKLIAWLLAGLPGSFLAVAGLYRRLFAGLLGWFVCLTS
jgi:hypothetical protein